MTPTRPLSLSVAAPAPPDPHLLRAAIAARLAGRPFPTANEDAAAAAIVAALREHPAGEEGHRWP